MLNRVFGGLHHGFYVDVGAYHPVDDSVTKTFYDRGWNGINIEPGEVFDELAAARPRDINLRLALYDRQGEISFAQHPGWYGGLSHVEESGAPTGSAGAPPAEVRTVACDTLTNILRAHAGDRPIAFLKIDAEGAELAIIRSTDWRAMRPTVLLIEATLPQSNELANQEWEPILLEQGYLRAYFDGINCFYVPEERADLLRAFATPVNVLDGFTRPDPAALYEARGRIHELATELTRTSAENMRYFEQQAFLREQIGGLRAQIGALQGQVKALQDHVTTQAAGVEELRQRHRAELATLYAARDAAADAARTQLHELVGRLDQVSRREALLLREAGRLHRLVRELRWPDGPGALRILLPVARLLRRLGGARTPDMLPEEAALAALAPPAGYAATGAAGAAAAWPVHAGPAAAPAAPWRSAARRLAMLAYAPLRPLVRPLAWRSRGFLTRDLHHQLASLDGKLQALMAQAEMVRIPPPAPPVTEMAIDLSPLQTELRQFGAMLETTLLTLALDQGGNRKVVGPQKD